MQPPTTRYLASANFSLQWTNKMCSKKNPSTLSYINVNVFHCQHVFDRTAIEFQQFDGLGGSHGKEASVLRSACSRDVKVRILSTQQQLFLAPSLTLSVRIKKSRSPALLTCHSYLKSAIDHAFERSESVDSVAFMSTCSTR